MMCVVAAAPHVFDDALVASPELALVDVDLAAQLREDIRTGEEFRPRTVARPELHLVFSAEVAEDDAAVEDVVELPEYVVPHEDDEVVVDVEPVVVALDAPPTPPVVDGLSELPDYVVAPEVPEEMEGGAAFLDVTLDSPAIEVSELPDYVVRADDLVVDEPVTSDYPVLPDLGEASVALEETDVALRKIREQFASEETSPRHRRLRRGFVAASGLGAIAALAVLAVDLQLGVATLPGWLGF
jgi:hypothetical protein